MEESELVDPRQARRFRSENKGKELLLNANYFARKKSKSDDKILQICPSWCYNCSWCIPVWGDPGSGSGGGSGSTCAEPCERDCENGTENIWRFRTTNDYDGWRGKGEWFFWYSAATDVQFAVQDGFPVLLGASEINLQTGNFTDVEDDDTWHYPNFSLIIWDQEDDGNRMKIGVFEDDGNSGTQSISFDLSFEFAGFGFEIPINWTFNDGDDRIGEYLVEYCHDIGSGGFVYHPSGAVDVQHNER